MKKPFILPIFFLLILTTNIKWTHAGYALSFNRNARQLVQIAESPSLDIDGRELTMEMWVKIPDPQVNVESVTINKENTYEMKVQASQFRVAIWTQANWAWEGGGFVAANEWTHIAATYDGQNVRNYVDGRLTSTTRRVGNVAPSDSALYFGTRPLGGFVYFYNGVIDEVRIWNITRSEQEINQTMNRYLAGNEEGLVGYWRLDEGEGQIVHDQTGNENHGHLGFEEDEDARDAEWVESDAPIRGGIVEVMNDEIEFGPIIRGQSREITLYIANISEDDDDQLLIDFTLTDLGDDPEWLDIDPIEGDIEPGDTIAVTLTADSEDLDLGEYVRTILFECNSQNLQTLEIPVHMFVVEGFGTLHGRVTNADNDRRVEGAIVRIDEFDIADTTDENGRYEFEQLPAWTYDIVAVKEDFLPLWELDIEIDRGDEVELNFALLHGEFAADPNLIDLAIGLEDSIDFLLLINNEGNGPLTWSVDLGFAGFEADPWHHRAILNVGQIVENDEIKAVEFDGQHFYVAGRVSDGDNLIYVLNRDGDLIRSFPQPGEGRFGFRDLTWDGNLLWGGDVDMVYGMNINGEVVAEFESPLNPARCIAWDPEHRLFWIADRISNIVASDSTGREIMEIRRPEDVTKHGLAWFPEDPDGYKLYILASEGDRPLEIYKLDVETGDIIFVADLSEIENASEGGMTITRLWDQYNWVLMSVMVDPAVVSVWQVAGRTEWLSISPVEGVAEADDESEVTVTLNTSGFADGTELWGELRFQHDGIGGEDTVHVAVTVSGDGGLAQRVLSLSLGWNLVSLNISPFAESFIDQLSPLVEADALILAKDGSGHFYLPVREFSNIETWDFTQGYHLKMQNDARLIVEGEAVDSETPIDLRDGWNSISYLPRRPVDAPIALNNLGESLTIAKDGYGRFYLREYGFSDLTMREGYGYQVRVEGAQELVYNLDDNLAGNATRYSERQTAWLMETERTDLSLSLLLLTENLHAGTHLEAYTPAGIPAGRGIVGSDGKCGMTLWGDDPNSESVEGFKASETAAIITDNGNRLPIRWVDGDMSGWKADGFAVAEIVNDAGLPVEFGLHSLFPNPFNSRLQVKFGLTMPANVNLTIFDVHGRYVETIISGWRSTGNHSVNWTAEGIPSGLYFIRLSTESRSQTEKVLLMK